MSVTRTTAQLVAAAQTLAAVAGAAVSPQNKAAQLQETREVFERARTVYTREVSGAVSKTVSGANLAALWTAASIADGLVFKVATTADTTDTALAAAKGSALAVGDVFQRSGSTVVFVGVLSDVTGLTAALAG